MIVFIYWVSNPQDFGGFKKYPYPISQCGVWFEAFLYKDNVIWKNGKTEAGEDEIGNRASSSNVLIGKVLGISCAEMKNEKTIQNE